jgi:hypothetical protein
LEKIYVKIDGGIGRVICSTGAIQEYARKNPDKEINVVTSHKGIFYGIEEIRRTYQLDQEFLYEDYISTGTYIEPEPYNDVAYYRDELHICSVFNKELNNLPEFVPPTMILTENELNDAKTFIDGMRKEKKKKILLIQPFGSQGGITQPDGQIKVDESYRSFGTGFLRKFIEFFKEDYTILSVQSIAHDNGKQVPQAEMKDTMAVNNQDIRKIVALISHVDGIVACDSFLHHASAALKTPVPTVVLWGATNAKNLSYQEHLNILSHKKVLFEPNRIIHNHSYYVDKNKNSNDFKEETLPTIKEFIEKSVTKESNA